MTFFRILVLTLVAAWASTSITRALAWPYWSYFALCAAIGLLCYIVSVALIGFFEKRAPVANKEFAPGTQALETTDEIGAVPKWVSWIALLAIAFFLAIPFELVASLVR